MAIRNKLYDSNYLKSQEYRKPIINIGNLTVGGTGKTPHVEYLIRLLQDKFEVATLSRGFKRKTHGFVIANAATNATSIGDEPMQYFFKYGKIKVAVCEDRNSGVQKLLTAFPRTKVILLDDAFQHRAIKAGLNIIISDYNNLFYKDHVLPFGQLREFRNGYKRADIIIVSKCPKNLSLHDQQMIIGNINPLAHQHVFFSTIVYQPIYDFTGLDFEANLKDKNILLITGIANNSSIIQHLNTFSASIKTLQYPDHHYFSPNEIDHIKEVFDKWEIDNKIILTTEKDIVRLALHFSTISNWQLPIYTLPIEMQLLNNPEQLDSIILNFISQYKKPTL